MSYLFVISLLRQPFYQLVLFLLLTILTVPFLGAKNANAIWNVAGVLYIGFILTNAVFFWFEDNIWTYFFISLAFSVSYVLAAGILVSLLISALKITGSGEAAMIFVFIIYHPAILLLMIFVRWIIRSI